MSLPASEVARPGDASLSLQFDDADADLLARAFRTAGDGPRAWRLNGEAHRISLIDGFDRLLAWPSLRGVVRYPHQERTCLRVLREMRGRAILADEVGLGKTIEAGKRDPHRALAQRTSWDLVIVDEAHRLKNRLSVNWRFVAGLSKKYMLLLTATPVQNDMDELFNLVSLLKPGALHTYDRFVERYVGSADGRVPTHVPELRDRLRDVMVRNRRGIAFTLPPRRVHSLPVRLSPRERRLYDDVTQFVRDAYWSVSGRMSWAARLTLIVLQREIGSSTFAVAETLNRLTQSPLFGAAERERLEALRDDARAIRSNVKADHLMGFLRSSDEKALVFTQYLRTMQYLKGVLEGDGHRVVVYHGGLPPAAKDAAVQVFRGGGQIFLSTEAGGEGRNLQFARTVANYDLPWNPLRIEQRIGRVHRLGQEREVHVVNLWARETVEAYLMELLDRKIHMFELVVGELDLILGNLAERRSFEDMMMEIWALRESEPRRAALQRLGEALVRARTEYDRMQERNEEALRPVSEEVAA